MKAFRICVAALVCLLLLAGCQEKESARLPATEEAAEPAAAVTADSFAATGELTEEPGLWATEYIRWEHKDGGYTQSDSIVFGDCIYQLLTVPDSEGTDYHYMLEIYDTSVMQSSTVEIDTAALGLEDSFIADMNVIDSGLYAFFVVGYKYEQEDTDRLGLTRAEIVYSDLEQELRRVDLLPAMRKIGLKDVFPRCFCDAAGNIYLRGIDYGYASNHLFMFDQDGSLWMEQELGDDVNLVSPFRMPGGELVFPVNDLETGAARLVLFDSAQKEMRVLASLPEESIERVYGMQGTALYYSSYEGIVRWDIASGKRALVFSFKDNSVSNIYNTLLTFRDGQPPVLRIYAAVNGQNVDFLAPLSEQEPQEAEAIRVVSLNGAGASVKDCAALASRWNPGLSFTYKTCGENEQEDFRARIMAELIAGGGPELLYVSLEDMKRLQEMGALADLGSFLTEEQKEQILPGIIELGTVDGVFVGLAPDMRPSAVVTLDSVWEQDTWTLEDVIGLMDTGTYTGILCQGTTAFAPQALLKFLTEFGLRESALIDWETRESHFDSDLFQKLLELAKTYGSDTPVDADTWLGSGGCPGRIVVPDIECLNELYEQYGDEYHFVGMPTEDISGNYVETDGVLVVNKNAANSEAISVYLSYLLGEEIQYVNRPFYTYPVLKVSLADTTTVETAEGEIKILWRENRVQVKEDGTTVLQDYKELLESCVPAPASYEDILSIVWEESQSYIAGDKSAREVARILDSRIQIYLDEGN